MEKRLDGVLKYGQMEESTKENGRIIERTVKDSFGMPMAIFMKVIGKTIRQTAMAFISTQTEQNI